MPVETTLKATEAIVETTAPVVAGTLDYKKVAIYAGTALVVAGCGYLAYRAIKKRKAAKEIIVVNPEPVAEEAPAEAE